MMNDTHLHEEHDDLNNLPPMNKFITNKSNKYNRLYQVIVECGGNPSQEQLDEVVRVVISDFLTNNPNIY